MCLVVKILDASVDGIEGSQLEGLVGIVEGLRGFAHGPGAVDPVQPEGLG